MNPLLIDMPGGGEWLLIAAVVLLLFGAKKLPELARGTGQALRIFKAETKGLRDGDDKDKAENTEADKPLEGKIVDTPRDTSAG